MNEHDKYDDALNTMFTSAKAEDPVPSGDLMSRIMADAAAVQTQAAVIAAPAPEPQSILQSLSDAFGGWAGVSTLVACVGLGLMVGFTSPETILSYVPGTAAEASEDAFGLYFDTDL